MSVINTMLRNLEERRAGVAGNAGLLDELSIPVRGQRFVPRIFVLGPLVVCAAAAATLYFWPRAEAAGSVAAVARLSPQDAGNRQLVAKAPTVFTPQQAVSSSQGDDARGMKGAGDSSETAADIALVLATSMAEAGDAAAGTRADKPVRRSFAKDDSAFVKVVSKPTGTVPEPRQLPAAEALPAAARQASPAAVAESGAIRVEQSTQTPAERNLMEVQHAAELQRRGSVVEAEASLRGVLANDRTMLAARQALFALLQRQQRFDEARALLREGVAIAPTQAALLLPYARLLGGRLRRTGSRCRSPGTGCRISRAVRGGTAAARAFSAVRCRLPRCRKARADSQRMVGRAGPVSGERWAIRRGAWRLPASTGYAPQFGTGTVRR